MCDSARRYAPGRSRQAQPEVAVDTASLANAFPDFTQGAMDQDSISIELARGPRRGTHARVAWNQHRDSDSDSVGSRPGALDVLTTPPQHTRRATSNKHDPVAKKAPARPTLAQMHARVVESEPTVTTERPPVAQARTRPTRFSQAKARQPSAGPARQANRFETPENFLNDLAQYVNKVSNPALPTGVAGANANAPNGTQQSYTLPDLPDLSELVSGMHHEGSLASSRRGKASSRFASAGPSRSPPNRVDHAGVQSIPVPGEERAIAISLKIMQDRLDQDEIDKAILQKEMGELKMENDLLRAQQKSHARLQRRDSAVEVTDSSSENEHGNARAPKTLAIQKTSRSDLASTMARLTRAQDSRLPSDPCKTAWT